MQTVSGRIPTIYQPNTTLCFLTGKAGTGKTTLLKEIIATTHKNTVVVAPTGIAALNAGGVHSLYVSIAVWRVSSLWCDLLIQIKFESKDTLRRHFKMSGLKKSVIRNMELLVIDEVVCSVLIAGRHGLHDANSA
jgi:superfamily II DNA or RNA helicase